MSADPKNGNKVRNLRLSAGLTQRDLAKRVGIGQQHLARIERGVQPASIAVAKRLCEALGRPLEKVFPRSRVVARILSRTDEEGARNDLFKGGKMTQALASAGIDLDPRVWSITLSFSNGVEQSFTVAASEQRRMREAMFRTDPFLVFDSEGARVAVNLGHLHCAHWLFEQDGAFVPESKVAEDGSSDAAEFDPNFEVVVHLSSDATPRYFGVVEDYPDEPFEDGGMGQMGHLLYMASNLEAEEAGYRFHFEDHDGEEVFLLSSAVSLISVPLWVVEPALLDARMEAFEQK